MTIKQLQKICKQAPNKNALVIINYPITDREIFCDEEGNDIVWNFDDINNLDLAIGDK